MFQFQTWYIYILNIWDGIDNKRLNIPNNNYLFTYICIHIDSQTSLLIGFLFRQAKLTSQIV